MKNPSLPPPVTAPLNWNRHDPESEARAHRIAAAKITAVFDLAEALLPIEVTLLVGEACPFTTRWEREIWLEEFRRISTERAERRQADAG